MTNMYKINCLDSKDARIKYLFNNNKKEFKYRCDLKLFDKWQLPYNEKKFTNGHSSLELKAPLELAKPKRPIILGSFQSFSKVIRSIKTKIVKELSSFRFQYSSEEVEELLEDYYAEGETNTKPLAENTESALVSNAKALETTQEAIEAAKKRMRRLTGAEKSIENAKLQKLLSQKVKILQKMEALIT